MYTSKRRKTGKDSRESGSLVQPASEQDESSSSGSESGAEHLGGETAESETQVGKTFEELVSNLPDFHRVHFLTARKGVVESLCEACATLGFVKPTPIQEEAIPLAL
jgi:ATP-dependent RNA helicase DDX47/RRP3